MSLNRREFIETASGAALATAAATGNAIAQSNQASTAFSIDEAFTVFMRDIGGTPADGGGTVTFTGSDPIVRSHFRIGTSMALPAMAVGVEAAAVWK
ncbi:MAG: twin-arginine translocation signal domain-containing protein, partial [Candidatus Cybelea sp.]